MLTGVSKKFPDLNFLSVNSSFLGETLMIEIVSFRNDFWTGSGMVQGFCFDFISSSRMFCACFRALVETVEDTASFSLSIMNLLLHRK